MHYSRNTCNRETTLTNCAIEPEIKDLIKFLNKSGSKIKFEGRKIIIEGNVEFKNSNIRLCLIELKQALI